MDTWPDTYSGYPPMPSTEDEDVGFGDPEYNVHYLPLVTEIAPVMGLAPSPMSAEFLHSTHSNNTLYPQEATVYIAQDHASTTHRHSVNCQLHINTQLSPYHFNDSELSTTSTSSFPAVLHTPYCNLYPEGQPSVFGSSPQLCAADGRMLMPESEKSLPFPVSPLSPYAPSFDRDMLGEPPVSVDIDFITQVQFPHILEWKRVMELCGMSGFIPQTVYQPYTEADRKRYIRDVELRETIFFQLEDSSELGVSLEDALRQRLRPLRNKDDRMFVGCGPSVSIRIQWPGYTPWSKQIPTMDFKTPKGNITRAKLAKNIAACVKRFVDEMQDKPMEAESDIRWRVGKRHIKVEDLILVSLHHVSKGSWQPQLRFRGPTSSVPRPWDESFSSISTL